MSYLPGRKRPYQDHLRYKHMVARLQNLPVHKKEAVFIAELARGKRWRIDAALEALCIPHAGQMRDINLDDAFKMVGRYGRLTAFSRLAEIFALVPRTETAWRGVRGLNRCFDEAVIHGHYRVAEAAWSYGAHPNVYLDLQEMHERPRAMLVAIEEKDTAKIDYLLSRGKSPASGLAPAVAKGDVAIVAHLLDRGADPSHKEQWMGMPLLALKYNQLQVFDLLVARGADVTHNADEMYADVLRRGNDIADTVRRLRVAGVPVSEGTLERATAQGQGHVFSGASGDNSAARRQPKP